MLEREDNPIAVVILAHRAAQRGVGDPVGRKAAKWQLTRRLYERGYEKKDILELFRLIDWLIQLPEDLAVEFRRELVEYEQQQRMPYITSIEELGRREGWQEGRQEGLIAAQQKAVLDVVEVRFGKVPEGLREAVESIQDEVRLSALLKAAIRADSVEELTRWVEDSMTTEV